jgi:hypothetical protein
MIFFHSVIINRDQPVVVLRARPRIGVHVEVTTVGGDVIIIVSPKRKFCEGCWWCGDIQNLLYPLLPSFIMQGMKQRRRGMQRK